MVYNTNMYIMKIRYVIKQYQQCGLVSYYNRLFDMWTTNINSINIPATQYMSEQDAEIAMIPYCGSVVFEIVKLYIKEE